MTERKSQREWRKKNPDKIKERNKKYRSKNKDKIREYQRAWAKKNPDKIRQKSIRYFESRVEREVRRRLQINHSN